MNTVLLDQLFLGALLRIRLADRGDQRQHAHQHDQHVLRVIGGIWRPNNARTTATLMPAHRQNLPIACGTALQLGAIHRLALVIGELTTAGMWLADPLPAG
jgi:hypothetical protein